jgi:hypothetical protein
MGPKARAKMLEPDARHGLKYLRSFMELLQPLMEVPAHGNRQFLYHQWVCLLLLHFYNPLLNSLRALVEATDFNSIQELTGVKHTSLGAMSDSAAKVFDPAYLEPIILAASKQVGQSLDDRQLEQLPGLPVAVDGSFLRCLPKMTWALFRQKSTKRGVRLHLHLDVRRGVPRLAQITKALGSEKKSLRGLLEKGMLYLLDRGYIDYALFQAIHDAGSFLVARLKGNSSFQVVQDRPLSEADRAAGVLSDQQVTLGSAFTEGKLTAPVRRIVIDAGEGKTLILLTNTEMSAELAAQMYRYRWQVELFFRWFKCVLGCRNWLSLSPSGLTLQVYTALLASILLALWTGLRPSVSALRVIGLYFQGWVRDEELLAHLQKLREQQVRRRKKKA